MGTRPNPQEGTAIRQGYGVPTYVDTCLTKEDYIVFEAGNHTDAIKLSYSDYERAAKPHVEEFGVKLYPAKNG